MSADSPRRQSRGVPAIVPPQVVSDRSIIDSVAGFINDVTLTNQPQIDPKDTITWARFETVADISDPTYGDDWELEGNVAPPLLLILGYGLGVQIWAIPANGEAVEVLSWRHSHVTTLRILPTPISSDIEMADEPIDQYANKRPLMAICEGSPPGCNSQFSSVNFISLKEGTQVKTIKFKNNILDILANRTSVVITFPERIAVFDARNLEDRLSITSCHPSPGINPNPVALGSRWLAYSENKLIHSKRSGGGCDGDGVSSYTATVLNAAKSLGKGLRELGEQVAAGLTGSTSTGSFSKPGSADSGTGDIKQPGVVTILDIKHSIKDVSPTSTTPMSVMGTDPYIAHFVAHLEAIVALEFDSSGMLLLTADKRGHDFHVYRIQPHPTGSQLAAVHHLYVLHRGDTSAKVQNIAFSLDSRWVAVSTLRGTTHVFPINPYGGPVGVRTHASLHVVNRLSRFHRSAGLSADGRSSSPISHSDSATFNQNCMPYNNPTVPPFPRPHVILPLAQLRQPSALGSPPSNTQNSYTKTSHGRQRLSSLSDDCGKPLSVCAIFAKARSWLLDPPNLTRDTPAHKIQRKAVDSLFIMAGHGALIQYDLDTKLSSNIAKEKICDDTPIELEVEAKAQWNLGRRDSSVDIQPPLASDNWLMKEKNSISCNESGASSDDEDRWLSQVEIITHAGPHRRLWMGPQCVFKTYNTPSGASLSHIDAEAIEIGINNGNNRPGRSSPMNMPLNANRSSVPVLIESGSYSSIEQSPKLMDRFRHEHMDSDYTLSHGESRLKEDLADAMRESPSVPQHKEGGLTTATPVTRRSSASQSDNLLSLNKSRKISNINVKNSDDENVTKNCSSIEIKNNKPEILNNSMSSALPIQPTTTTECQERHLRNDDDRHQPSRSVVLIEKIVNPLGTVTTIKRSSNDEIETDNPSSSIDYVIHENCDESLFRPVVAIFRDNDGKDKCCNIGSDIENSNMDENNKQNKIHFNKAPEPIGTELVVPVIEKVIKNGKNKKEKISNILASGGVVNDVQSDKISSTTTKFDELSLINKKSKPTTTKGGQNQNVTKIEKDKIPSTLSFTNENSTTTAIKKNSKSGKKKLKEDIKQNNAMTTAFDEMEKITKCTEKLKQNEIEEITDICHNNNIKGEKLRNQKLKIGGNDNDDNDDTDKILDKHLEKNKKMLDGQFTAISKSDKLLKVSSDPKLSKYNKTLDVYDNNNIKSASSEKSLKIKNKEKNKQQSKKMEGNIKIKTEKNTIMVSSAKHDETDSSDTIKFYEKFTKESSSKDLTDNIQQCDEIDADLTHFTSIYHLPSSLSSSSTRKNKLKSQQTNSRLSLTENFPKLCSEKSQNDIENVLNDAKNEDNNSETVLLDSTATKKKICLTELEQSKLHETFDEVNNLMLDLISSSSSSSSKKIEQKDNQKSKKNPSTSPFEYFTPDLTEKFLPPLSPLEPFESNFENIYCKESVVSSSDHLSLINFESPIQETQSKSKGIIEIDENKDEGDAKEITSNAIKSATNQNYLKENIVLALCGSLHYDEDMNSNNNKNSENSRNHLKKPFASNKRESDKTNSDDHKESQTKNFDNEEQYLSLEPAIINYHDHTSASSSEETEESSCIMAKSHNKKSIHHHHEKLVDDDEELRPLIGGANSACSMTSSTGGNIGGGINDNKNNSTNDKISDDDRPEMIVENSKSAAVTNQISVLSEYGDNTMEDAMEEDKSNIKFEKINDESIENTSVGVSAAAATTMVKQQQQLINSAIATTNIGSCGATGGGGGGAQTNGKKKSKKKKR